MSYLVRPIPENWSTQYDSFVIRIRAYDDTTGKPIKNRGLELQYYISTDISAEPDPNNMIRLFADANGLLELPITNECRITAKLIYDKSSVDPSIGRETVILCEDTLILFQPFIVYVSAEYTGGPVPINSYYDPSKIRTRAYFNNGSVVEIPYTEITYPYERITQMGNNDFTIGYYYPLLDKTFYPTMTVIGTYQITGIYGIYVGEMKLENEEVVKQEIEVYVKLFDGYNEIEQLIPEEEWSFNTIPFPNKDNNGIIKIEWNGRIADVRVIFEEYDSTNWKLKVWYEGVDIPVGEKYDVNDLRIRVTYGDKNTLLLTPNQVSIKEYEIKYTGWNWFEVIYTPTTKVNLKEWFAVYGYNPVEHEAPKFKVVYIDGNDVTEPFSDVTDKYKVSLQAENPAAKSDVYITWEKFRKIAVSYMHYGKLRVTVPKFSGLGYHTATEWMVHIYKEHKECVDAVLIRYINKERNYGDKEKIRSKPERCD